MNGGWALTRSPRMSRSNAPFFGVTPAFAGNRHHQDGCVSPPPSRALRQAALQVVQPEYQRTLEVARDDRRTLCEPRCLEYDCRLMDCGTRTCGRWASGALQAVYVARRPINIHTNGSPGRYHDDDAGLVREGSKVLMGIGATPARQKPRLPAPLITPRRGCPGSSRSACR